MTTRTRVLVVDDSRPLVRGIEGFLQKQGFEVLTAFSGLEAIQRAQEERPDVIVLDIVMPGMNGYEACHFLKDDPVTSGIPVIFLTVKGRADEEGISTSEVNRRLKEERRAFEVGGTEFITKPVRAAELLDRIKATLWLVGKETK